MKRLISFILVLGLICAGLAACASKTPAQVLSEAVVKTSSLDSMEAVMEMTMEMKSNGQTISIPVTYEIKAQGLQSDSPKMLMSMAMDMSASGFSTTIEMDIYTEDGWAYVSSDGVGYKMKQDDAENQLNASDMRDLLQVLPEELLTETEFKKNDDGSQTMTVSVPGEQFEELYDSMIDSMNATAGAEVSELTISNAVVTVTVKDGYVSEYEIDFTMNMEVSGTAIETTASASVTYKDPGKTVTVTPPEGYQDFTEISQ